MSSTRSEPTVVHTLSGLLRPVLLGGGLVKYEPFTYFQAVLEQVGDPHDVFAWDSLAGDHGGTRSLRGLWRGARIPAWAHLLAVAMWEHSDWRPKAFRKPRHDRELARAIWAAGLAGGPEAVLMLAGVGP